MSISYNAVMWTGLSLLMAGVTVVSAVTLYKSVKQEKKLEAFNTSLEAIENNNQQAVQGLRATIDDNTEKQKKANKENSPQLAAARTKLSEVKEALDSAKVVYEVVKEDLPVLLNALQNNGGGNVNVDINKWCFVAGPGAPAVGAGVGVQDMGDLCDKIAAAMKNYQGLRVGGPEPANDIWGRLNHGAAGAANAGPVANYKNTALNEAKNRVAIAERNVKEAEKLVKDIEKTLS